MIDSIITGYINNNKRLVVPDFGAFIRKDGGELVFVEFLKKDDGVLNSLLRTEYGLGETEAGEAIAEYAATVRRTVGQTGQYVVEGVGTLHTDPNGLYALRYDPQARREAFVPHATVGEQFISQERETVAAAMSMPAVGEDIVMQERVAPETVFMGETVRQDTAPEVGIHIEPRFPREEIVAELEVHDLREPARPQPTPVAEQPYAIELERRETDPVPVAREGMTLNDLYTMPATPAVEQPRQTEPVGHPAGHAAHAHHGQPQPQSGQGHHQGQQRSATASAQPAQPRPSEGGQRQGTRPATPYQKPRPAAPAGQRPVNYGGRSKPKKIDLVMIIAVIAALAAIISIVVGLSSNSTNIKPTNPQTEQVVPADQTDMPADDSGEETAVE
ncbi:hypothetical protein LJC45_06170 [Alistipes sp. OttesenSCG-928-B03]|nr:hypothetical protein [Alistipes sp. OttesenSCG-928-B03]